MTSTISSHVAHRGSFADYSTTPDYPLGHERSEYITKTLVATTSTVSGWATYRYVKNTGGATFTVGVPQIGDATDIVTGFEVEASGAYNAPEAFKGVPISAVPVNSYGWLQISGPTLCVGDGAIAKGEYVVLDNATFDTIGVSEVAVGVALELDSPNFIANLF